MKKSGFIEVSEIRIGSLNPLPTVIALSTIRRVIPDGPVTVLYFERDVDSHYIAESYETLKKLIRYASEHGLATVADLI